MVTDVADDLRDIARAEFAAWREWSRNRVGPEPGTPNLDRLRSTIPTTNHNKEKHMPTTTVRFYRNGKPFEDRYNTFGRVGRRDGYTAATMRKTLADAGITEPTSSTWTFTIPSSGVVVGAVADGDKVPAELLVTSDETKPAPKATKRTKAKNTDTDTAADDVAVKSVPVVEIVEHGKQSFAVLVDGEQIGTRRRSMTKAYADMRSLAPVVILKRSAKTFVVLHDGEQIGDAYTTAEKAAVKAVEIV